MDEKTTNKKLVNFVIAVALLGALLRASGLVGPGNSHNQKIADAKPALPAPALEGP